MNRIVASTIAVLWFLSGFAQGTEMEIQMGKSLNNLEAAVACAHPEAAKIGAEILRQGGNAVDASVAIQWALAVCYPQAGNIGGGGFMVLRLANGKTTALDYREMAPAKASANMYLDKNNNILPGKSLNTHLAAGVPGSVSGIFESHRKFGHFPMAKLIKPAIALAENGFEITENQAKLFNQYKIDFERRNRTQLPFVKKTEWEGGDRIIQSNLAATLRRITDNGESEFYSGRTANFIVEEMQKGGGDITIEDLAYYKPIWREPIRSDFEEFTILSFPPPSSGGIALVQLLEMWETAVKRDIKHNSVEYIHLITEMERRVYADKSVHLGDPDFYNVPLKQLIDPTYLTGRMADYDPEKATPSEEISAGKISIESTETTHLSVVDSEGNAVSITTTLNGHFGSKIMVTGAGFFLNNEMDDFSSKPGTPNLFGLIGGKANAIAPQKRMLSSMTPTIVEKNGELFLVAGSPGGSTIITSVFQTIMNVTVFKMDLEKAISAPKFHSQWLPDSIFLEEDRFSIELIQKLKSLNHEIAYVPSLGRIDAILVNDKNALQSCGDPRADDTAAGYYMK